MYLSVIIPCYNEEKTIEQTLEKVVNYCAQKQFPYEIIVVNDGSTDNSKSKIKNTSALLLENNENKGKGYSVRRGMLSARGAIRLFLDADYSTSIEHFDSIEKEIKNGADVVIGSRNQNDARDARIAVAQSFIKQLSGMAGNQLIQSVLLPGIWDTRCGFKAFTDRAAHSIFSRAVINTWAFDDEALFLARKMKMTIKKIPVEWHNNSHSRVKWYDYCMTLRDLIKIRLAHRLI
ncbi:MAG: glycosyltransferase family 2 protein [Parcubacteria group bacterium]|nr:glycosyltransferase family 2 protein [Parcubacteria group bacterium]